MRYSRRILYCLERIILYNPTLIMSITDFVAIYVETSKIDYGYSLEKEFTKFFLNQREKGTPKTVPPRCH